MQVRLLPGGIEIPMNYAKALKQARVKKGYSQRKLAEMLGVRQGYLSMLESGKRIPSLKFLDLVSSTLKIPMYALAVLASDPDDFYGLSQKDMLQLSRDLVYTFFRK